MRPDAHAPSVESREDREAAPTVKSVSLGGSALSRCIQARGAPPEWRVVSPSNVAGWSERARDTQAAFATHDWWRDIAPATSQAGAGRERLERVARAGGVVVTTGQQPGLFGGPVYTWSKALSALALADEIERVTGVPAAPLFWAATDDADLAEAQRVWVSLEGGARELRGTADAPAGTPASTVRQGHLGAQLASLREASGSAMHAGVLAAAEAAYGNPGATIGDAYIVLLESVLAPLGIAVIDASHPAIRRAGGTVVRRALDEAEAVQAALSQRTAAIRSHGFEPQVDDVAGLTPVFVYDGESKRRVRIDEASLVASSTDYTGLGPNVLLRPIVEAGILPTVAYVAGPAELAYFAQVTALAEAIGARIPVAVPRWSGVIVEPRMQRLLARLGVEPGELADPHAVEGVLARAGMPQPLAAALAQAAESVAGSVGAIDAADRTDLIPTPVLDGLKDRLAHQLARLERRALAAVKRREAMLVGGVATARGYFFPGGKPQERALAIIPFLARSGPRILDAMITEARRHAAALVSGRARTGGEA
ncbi:MAG: bacillithiol biosynthesis BshC [Gemmatimonadaceae bacterium]|nr:bacillithiol biosynthesis BshC [Gemmatimonadaceae bacterium]